MKLLITTQIYENYAWNEDGTIGTGDAAYWKAKGGGDYIVIGEFSNDEDVTMAVMSMRGEIEQSSDYFNETIVGWNLVEDDYLTEYERDQLEYEGKITFPAKELVWA